jgi:SAM-dependent methyltransferase
MSLYKRWILPRLTHLSMRQKQLAAYRARALAGACGRVLEIGIGSGLNLPFSGQGVQRVLGIDPSPELIRLAEQVASKASFPVELLVQSAGTPRSVGRNTEIRGSWAYSELMPVVPVHEAGLSPLAQWIVIPLAAFWRARPALKATL